MEKELKPASSVPQSGSSRKADTTPAFQIQGAVVEGVSYAVGPGLLRPAEVGKGQ